MKTLTRKHWIVFAILTLFNLALFTFISGTIFSILSILLPIFLIPNFLKESLMDYGIHFKKIHIQIISAFVLAFIILFLMFSDSTVWLKFTFLAQHLVMRLPSVSLAFGYFFNTLIFAISEEILFRGFYLSFFQKLFNNPFASIFLSAILFGLSHYPRNRNLQQVVFAFVIGLIYGYLRIKEPEKFTVFSLSLAHFLHNIFM